MNAQLRVSANANVPSPAVGKRAEVAVIQLGPGLNVRGGVSAVERLIVQQLRESVVLRHLSTMEEGSSWHKLRVFMGAVREFSALLHSRSKPHIVHIHFASRGSTWRKLIFARMTLRAQRRLVLHAHGGAFGEFYGSLPLPARRLIRNTFCRADRLVVLSDRWRTFYTKEFGLSEDKVTVLHNPVRLPPVVPDRRGRRFVQVLYLGRISEPKGAFDLLQAFSHLPQTVRERARLVFAGDGEHRRLREQSASLGAAVTVLDWVDASQRDRLLVESDIFALPSYKEGLPMSLLEAMAYGLPPIVSPVGGIPDVVAEGREGMLVPPGALAQLREALHRLITDEACRLRLGMQARERAGRFDITHYARDLLALYRDVAAI